MSFETWIREHYGRDVNLMELDITRKVVWDASRAESEADLAVLQSERDALKQRIEQLEVQMTGITTVALGWGIKESEIVEKGAWAWSVPYQDVLDLRRKYDALQEAARNIASSGVISIDKVGTPREPAIVDGCEGYQCICCEKKPTTKHLRLRWTYYPLCHDCWEILSRALTPASGEPARKPVELKPRTFTEVAEHFTKVTKPVDWPTDEPDID